MKLYNIFWLLIAAIAAAVPVFFIKYYLKKKDNIWIILSILFYVFLLYCYTILLKDDGISTTYALLKIFSIIIVVVGNRFLFDIEITTRSYIGIVFGIISIYLLSKNTSV
jgi:multidrug transporter EmrE-like cation transporter